VVIFYKFCKINEYLIQSLFEKNIYLNEPKYFNDPAESNFKIDWAADVEEMNRGLPVKLLIALLEKGLINTKYKDSFDTQDIEGDALIKPMNRSLIESFCYKIIRDAQKSYRITSFTTSNLNPLMWGHYSDGMRGVSLGYRLPENELKKIVYGNPYRVNVKNIILESEESEVVNTFLRKHKDWKYEKEYRLIGRNKFYSIGDKDLHSITFGYRCDPDKARFIMKLVNKVYDHKVIFKIAISSLSDYGITSFVVEDSDELFKTLKNYEKREEIYEEFEMDRTADYFLSLLDDLEDLDSNSEIELTDIKNPS